MTSKSDNGETIETLFPLHDCTDQDFEEFPPLQEKHKDAYETLTADGTSF